LNGVEALRTCNNQERVAAANALQEWLVQRVREYFARQRISVEIRLDKPVPQVIHDILSAAQVKGLAGAVAQHLVGAKLAVRYPDSTVENHSYTTADAQLGRSGDFTVGDTIIHVTVAPMPLVFEKCRGNLNDGFGPT
jgi:hypothetical protein